MSSDLSAPRVAIAHDYLTQRGGAERVVLALTRAFPDAPVYTTLFDPASTFPEFSSVDVRTSGLNRVSAFRRDHRLALPVLAMAANSIRIDADVVIASSSGWAHGFRTSGAKVVYCYSPARWLYQSGRLWVLPSGRIPPNPSELLGSETMEKLLHEIRSEFKYVVIDAPPLLPVTDGAVLSKMTGGAVLVVRAGSTGTQQLRQAIESLENIDASLLGIVLNMLPGRGPDSYGVYGGYYYRAETSVK